MKLRRIRLERVFPLIKECYHNIKTGIPNLIRWFPIIWKQRDWDYGYLIDLVDFKLGLMAKTIKENAIIDANNRVSKQIEYARFLLKRAYSDCTLEAEFEAHSKKYPFDIKKLTGEKRYGMAEMREFRSLMEREALIQQDAKKRLAKHLDKYLQRWWD